MLANPTTQEHYEKYARLAEVIGIDASNHVPVGEYDYILGKYLEDNILNNIPLKVWDRWGLSVNFHHSGLSIAELCCLCKHVTVYQFLGAKPVFFERSPKKQLTIEGFKQLSAISATTWEELSKNGEKNRDIIDVQGMYNLWREATRLRFKEAGIDSIP